MTLRIVGGELSGRRFRGPADRRIRPTSERVREALASALEARSAVAGARVLDLFAGTGALSFEMLSRGAAQATMVDRDRRALAAIRAAARELALDDRITALELDLLGRPETIAARLPDAMAAPATLLLADPPWAEAPALPRLCLHLLERGVITHETLCVLEHPTRSPLDLPVGLASVARYRYGDTSVVLARAGAAEE